MYSRTKSARSAINREYMKPYVIPIGYSTISIPHNIM